MNSWFCELFIFSQPFFGVVTKRNEPRNLFIYLFTGVDADLYYVRDGVVNDYALNFVILIPSHISALFFTWQSLAGKAVIKISGLNVSYCIAEKEIKTRYHFLF